MQAIELTISRNIPVSPEKSHLKIHSFLNLFNVCFSANAYILVYDLNDLTTFTFVRTIREQIIKSRDMKRIPILIVGNKADLIGEAPPADTNKRKDIFNLVVKHWGCPHVEASSRHNLGVIRIFKELLIKMDELDPQRTGQKETNIQMIDNINEALDVNKCIIL